MIPDYLQPESEMEYMHDLAQLIEGYPVDLKQQQTVVQKLDEFYRRGQDCIDAVFPEAETVEIMNQAKKILTEYNKGKGAIDFEEPETRQRYPPDIHPDISSRLTDMLLLDELFKQGLSQKIDDAPADMTWKEGMEKLYRIESDWRETFEYSPLSLLRKQVLQSRGHWQAKQIQNKLEHDELTSERTCTVDFSPRKS